MSLLYQSLALDEMGRPIYMGVFSNIHGPLPAPLLFIISNQYTNGFGLHRQYTVISDPDGEVLAQSNECLFTLHSVLGAHRVDERMGVEFNKPGRHSIRVLLNDDVVIEYYFMITESKKPAEGTET